MRRLRARLVAAAVLVTGLVGAGALPAAALSPAAGPLPAAQAVAGPLVVVGMGGVRWSDVDEKLTPALASLVGEAAVADVAVRSVRTATCRSTAG